MVRTIFAALCFLLLSIPSYAGWDSDEDGTGDGCEVEQPNPTRQRRCWWNFTGTGTGYSNMLKVDQCENWSLGFEPDFDGTETAATIQALICLDDAVANIPNACHILGNVTMSSSIGDQWGADATWLVIDIITAPGATANARVEFRCNQ